MRLINGRIKALVGTIANHLPYSIVPSIGKVYNGYVNSIFQYEGDKDNKEWIFHKVYAIVDYSIKNVPFYQRFYAERGFELSMLKSFDDIDKIPIVTKHDLMNVDIEKRSAPIKGRFVSCTSGSTGVTLSFYKVYSQKIKEMAYYHSAWKKLGYKKYKLRMQFVGNQEPKGFVYELARNEIRVSIHEPFANILRDAAAYKIEFIQGYPSVVYEFALYCSQHLEDFEMSGLRKSLRAIFLNSEYPQPTYTDKIKEIFCVPYVVSYGHTEGCALAFDYGNGNYEVLQSYGYVETVKQDDGNHLVATSYDNYASPMIRYDTNDIVDSEVMHNGVLSSFCMTGGGRNGQFVKDINGVKIPLTGLISGRHHRLMTYCSQLQISQKEQGRATIYYVPLPGVQENLIPEDLFDARGVAIDFEFKKILEPIRTKSGKVLLLVK